jgi:hypothetical protein
MNLDFHALASQPVSTAPEEAKLAAPIPNPPPKKGDGTRPKTRGHTAASAVPAVVGDPQPALRPRGAVVQTVASCDLTVQRKTSDRVHGRCA